MADTDTHSCPGGCGLQIPRRLLACRADWYRLPGDIRSWVNRAYRRNASEHRLALREAMTWYRDNPPGSTNG